MLNDTERLICYDTVVARAGSKSSTGLERVAPTREQLFGVHGEVANPRSEPERRERIDLQDISARLVEIRRHEGSPELVLDNGQVWRALTENETALLKPGDTVSIARAAFGSFRLVTPSGRFTKAVRIR